MADLKHMTRDKRGRWQYRRHIPKPVRFRFKGAGEFARALPGPSDAERAKQYLAADADYMSLASGEVARRALGQIVPRANNPNAPRLSVQAMKVNRDLAALPAGPWLGEGGDTEEDDPPSVTEAAKRFLADPLRAATANTQKARGPHLDTLCALLGENQPVAGITKASFRTAVELLHRLPREYRRYYVGLTPQQAIYRATADKKPTLSPKTVAHYIDTWRSFLLWCETEDLIASSPAKTLKPPKVKRNKDRQDAWTTPALNTLFGADLYQSPEHRTERPGAFWVPIIALLQGMRLAEIVLLVKADLIDVQGIPCFDIRERPGRTIKNEPSVRTVPVHKELIALGLLDYVRDLPDGPLWPDLMVGKRGDPLKDPADMYGKAFERQLTGLELSAPGLVFHALRHRFATACRAARMPDSCRQYLGGWAQSEGVASGYGKQDIAALKEELDAVKYAGVMLPSAYPTSHSEGEFVQPVATRIRATP